MKKNYLKRVMAAALAGVMAMGVFGCGSASATDTTAESGTIAGTESSAQTASMGEAEVYWFSDVTGWGTERMGKRCDYFSVPGCGESGDRSDFYD